MIGYSRAFNELYGPKPIEGKSKMNKRIRELAEQAGIEFDDDFPLEPETIYYLKLSDFEKFASLIVRECIDTVSDCSIEYCTRPQIVSEIKEHFGVR